MVTTRRCNSCERDVDVDAVHRCGARGASWNLANARAFVKHIVRARDRWEHLTGEGERADARRAMLGCAEDWRRWLGSARAGFLLDELEARSHGSVETRKGTRPYNCVASLRRCLKLRIPVANGCYAACVEELRRFVGDVAPESADLVDGGQLDMFEVERKADLVGNATAWDELTDEVAQVLSSTLRSRLT